MLKIKSQIKKLSLPLLTVLSFSSIFLFSSCSQHEPQPEPQTVIIDESTEATDNTMFLENSTTPILIPNSINLKTLSKENNGSTVFLILGTLTHTIFIPSDFSCSLLGSSDSNINVDNSSAISTIGAADIVFGNRTANTSSFNADFSISNLDLFSPAYGIYFSNSILGNVEISNNAISSTSTIDSSDIYFSNAISQSAKVTISDNVLTSSSTASSSNVHFEDVFGLLEITNNVFSSHSASNYGIFFSDSVTGIVTISNNVISSESPHIAIGIYFTATIFSSTQLTISLNSITATSSVDYDSFGIYFSVISSYASIALSNNNISSFSFMDNSYGIYFLVPTFSPSVLDLSNKNLFYWDGNTGTSLFPKSIPSIDFFSNGTLGVGQHTTYDGVSAEFHQNQSVSLFYADIFDGATQSGWDVGQIDVLSDELTNCLNLTSNSTSKSIINDLIEQLEAKSPWTNAIKIYGNASFTTNQPVYNDDGSAVLFTLPICVNLATLSGATGIHYFEIEQQVSVTIFIPLDFYAYLRCGPNGSISVSSTNSDTYGIVSGNDKTHSVGQETLLISNTTITSSSPTASYGICFANTIDNSIDISGCTIHSVFGICFQKEISAYIDILDNNIFSDTSAPRNLYFSANVSGVLNISDNTMSSSSDASAPTNISFANNVSGDLNISDNILFAGSNTKQSTNISFDNNWPAPEISGNIKFSNNSLSSVSLSAAAYNFFSYAKISAAIDFSNNTFSVSGSNTPSYNIYFNDTFLTNPTLNFSDNIFSNSTPSTQSGNIYFSSATVGTTTISSNVFSCFASGGNSFAIVFNYIPAGMTFTYDPNNKNIYYWAGNAGTPFKDSGSDVLATNFFSNGANGLGEKANPTQLQAIVTCDNMELGFILTYADTYADGDEEGSDVGQKSFIQNKFISYLGFYTNSLANELLDDLILQLDPTI